MKGYKLNLSAKTLTITKGFEEAVAKGDTAEYRLYKKLMRDIPGLTIERKTHERPKSYTTRTGEVLTHNKNKGLTYEKMEAFISTLSNSEELMEQYLENGDIAKEDIKTSIANDNLTQISAVESHLEEQISSLEKIYRRADVL